MCIFVFFFIFIHSEKSHCKKLNSFAAHLTHQIKIIIYYLLLSLFVYSDFSAFHYFFLAYLDFNIQTLHVLSDFIL